MAWIYGSELCVQPHIHVCDWVYGDELCITMPTTVYPTSAKVRVTSLIHKWSPGSYTLQIGLGDLTSEFTIDDIIMRPPAVTPGPGDEPIPPMPECIEGNYTCVGRDKYVCFEGRWRLALKDAPECTDSGCLEGSTKCEGNDKYICFEGRWRLSLKNSPECMDEGGCLEGSYKCVGNNKMVCFEGRWRMAQTNAPECRGI